MSNPAPIRSAAEFLAHALAIEREAAERYGEFARYMDDHDRPELAELFERLAEREDEHARFIEKRAGSADLPAAVAAEHRWLEAGRPDPAVHEWLFRLLTPRDALKLALDAERRAEAYFARIAREAETLEIRRLAQEFSEEEAEHAAWLERLITAEPDPRPDWERIFAERRRNI